MNDTHSYEQTDRRTTIRRKEDYFWLKRLADLTDEACLAVNRDLQIEFIDDKVFELLQMPPLPEDQVPDLGTLTWEMARLGYFGQGDPKVFEALISDLLTNQRLKQTKATQIIKAVTPSGKHIDIRVSLGRDDGYLILMRDITQEELRRQALNTAMEVGESGYWHYNLKTREFQASASSLREFFSDEKYNRALENGFLDLIHPDDVEKARESMKQVITSCLPLTALIRALGDKGDVRWLKSNIMPNVDESGKARSLSCFFTDVTQATQTQNKLRKAQKKAEKALEEKNDFLGRLSHEVRTPLNAVVGMADALLHSCQDDAILSQLTLIQNSAEKVMDLVDGTLEHAKLSSKAVQLNLKEISPTNVVENAYRTWLSKAQNDGTRLLLKIDPSVPEQILLDEGRYEQCLNNLLSNALKFSKGGVVQIVLATAKKNDVQNLVLLVKDNGIGMTPESVEKIFRPFKQADKSISGRFGGTGLGLSIVHDLVDLMGGKIKVSSQFGKGTVFAITVPLMETSLSADAQDTFEAPSQTSTKEPNPQGVKSLLPVTSVPSPQPSIKPVPVPTIRTQPVEVKTVSEPSHTVSDTSKKDEPDSPFGHLRVLIVDDNATNHIVASSLLSPVVNSIDTALNGEDALQKLAANEYDLVLMDIHMPVMDGIETTLAIRSEPSSFQKIPIIALTADPQYQQTRLCRNIGMNASLGKPIKLSGLLQAFDDVLYGDAQSISIAAA